MRSCPALATDDAAGNSNVHMVDGTTGVDHVFMTEDSAPRDVSRNGYSTYAPYLTLMLAIAAFMYFAPP